MLIRKQNGSVFHIVCGISKNKRFYYCLCGEKVIRNCEAKQLMADGSYIRCPECRRIQNEKIMQARGL